MAARESRDKKGVQRFSPVEKAEKEKNIIYEGSGTKLGSIPIVPVNLNKIDADHDLLKAFHSFLYGAVGKKTVRKKNIRSFSGFAEVETERAARVKKLGESKKWTVAALKDLCTLLGLEKGGDKSDVVDRVVSFLCSPDPSASKGPVAKKPKPAAKKRKLAGKGKDKQGKKVKREIKPRPVSGYIMFCKAARPKIAKDAGPMKPQEMMAKLAEKWGECSDAQKDKYKNAGIKEFEKKKAGAGGAVAGGHEDDGEGGDEGGDDDGSEGAESDDGDDDREG